MVHIRWMIRRDVDSVLWIDNLSSRRLRDVWAEVRGFPDYEISTFGLIRSKARTRITPHPRNQSVQHTRIIDGKLIKPYTDRDGYLTVSLRRDGKSIKQKVHRLVLETFIGPPPSPDHQGCHYTDHCRSNNRIDNLSWGTMSENRRQSNEKLSGDNHWNARLTSNQAQEIRSLASQGRKQRDLAKEFGVSESHISAIALNQKRREVILPSKVINTPEYLLDTSGCMTEESLTSCLRQRNCIGMVAELSDEVVGFMIYELHKNRLHLLSLAVHPDHRHKGVGRAMVEKLIGKLSSDRRNRIMLEVRETNLGAQLFWKAMGFKAISVLRDFYDDTTEDAYLMSYRCNTLISGAVDCVFGEC